MQLLVRLVVYLLTFIIITLSLFVGNYAIALAAVGIAFVYELTPLIEHSLKPKLPFDAVMEQALEAVRERTKISKLNLTVGVLQEQLNKKTLELIQTKSNASQQPVDILGKAKDTADKVKQIADKANKSKLAFIGAAASVNALIGNDDESEEESEETEE